MRAIYLLSVVVAALSECASLPASMTLPLHGQVQDSAETFEGSLTSYADRSGYLHAVMSTGAICDGSFVTVRPREDKGVVTCGDKRSGVFEYVVVNGHGNGFGDLGGQRMTFTFGP